MTFLNSELTSSMAIKKNEDFINDYSDILRFRKMQIYAEADSTLSALFTVRLKLSFFLFYSNCLNRRRSTWIVVGRYFQNV